MITYSKIFLSLFLFFCFSRSNAQVTEPELTHHQKIKPAGTEKAAEGTFQIIKIGIKSPQELFTDDLLYLIEANRDASVNVEINIGNFTRVKILSYSIINDPSFVPLSGEIIVEPTE